VYTKIDINMSKDLFFKMREEEIVNMYDASFTKKEAIYQGKKIVQNVLDNGIVDKSSFMASVVRLKTVVDTIESEMRENLPFEKATIMGVEFIPVNGGESLNYKDDPIYADIFNELKERESLLKAAYNSKNEIYDENGIEITKVSATPRKSSITIKF
jgi:hypothetical protein